MSKKLKKKITLSRRDAADRVIAIGEALSASGEPTFELGGETIAVSIPDELKFELEIEENELEIELKWKRTPSARPKDEVTEESTAAPTGASEQTPATADVDRIAQ